MRVFFERRLRWTTDGASGPPPSPYRARFGTLRLRCNPQNGAPHKTWTWGKYSERIRKRVVVGELAPKPFNCRCVAFHGAAHASRGLKGRLKYLKHRPLLIPRAFLAPHTHIFVNAHECVEFDGWWAVTHRHTHTHRAPPWVISRATRSHRRTPWCVAPGTSSPWSETFTWPCLPAPRDCTCSTRCDAHPNFNLRAPCVGSPPLHMHRCTTGRWRLCTTCRRGGRHTPVGPRLRIPTTVHHNGRTPPITHHRTQTKHTPTPRLHRPGRANPRRTPPRSIHTPIMSPFAPMHPLSPPPGAMGQK